MTACEKPPKVANAIFKQTETLYTGSVVNYTCDTNFVLQNWSFVVCDENGKWSAAPTCLPSRWPRGTPDKSSHEHKPLYHFNRGGQKYPVVIQT